MMKLTCSTRFYLAVGLVGSIIVGIGEYLLHFNPSGPAGEIDMLLHVPLVERGLAIFSLSLAYRFILLDTMAY